MKVLLLIAAAAFLSAFLGCVQSINVNRRRFGWACLTSFGIGLCQLTLYKQIPKIDEALQGAVFIFAGVAGAQLSMIVALRSRESGGRQ